MKIKFIVLFFSFGWSAAFCGTQAEYFFPSNGDTIFVSEVLDKEVVVFVRPRSSVSSLIVRMPRNPVDGDRVYLNFYKNVSVKNILIIPSDGQLSAFSSTESGLRVSYIWDGVISKWILY
jgi:hypothetical protein